MAALGLAIAAGCIPRGAPSPEGADGPGSPDGPGGPGGPGASPATDAAAATPPPFDPSACDGASGDGIPTCQTGSDCLGGDSICFGPPVASVGVCPPAAFDGYCDEGEVHILTVPPPVDWGAGPCVPWEWRDWLCCNEPEAWDCDGTT